MVFKENFFNTFFLLLCIVSSQQLSGFFSSFSQVGHNISIGITFDQEVAFNIHYAIALQNAHNYVVNLGFKMMNVMHGEDFNANFYFMCRHNDGLSSLQDVLSLVNTNNASEPDATLKLTCTHSNDNNRNTFSLREFLLRSFFSLEKSISFNVNDTSSRWSLKSGAEAITDFFNILDCHDKSMKATKDASMHYLNGMNDKKKRDITFDKKLFNTLIFNHALQCSILAMVLLADQSEELQKQWVVISQGARSGWEQKEFRGINVAKKSNVDKPTDVSVYGDQKKQSNECSIKLRNPHSVMNYLKRRNLVPEE